MKSKAGSILLLISGILTALVSVVFLFLVLIIPIIFGGNGSTLPMILLILIFAALAIITGFKFWASSLMKSPSTTTKGGIVALVVGVIGGIDLISIIGGIVGIIQGES